MLGQEDRDDFGNWAFTARTEALRVTQADVAHALNYTPGTITKAEKRTRSRALRGAMVELYQRLAAERGVTLPPVPGQRPTASGPSDDLLAVVRQQQGHIETLTGAIERQSQDIAALTDLVRQLLMPRPSTPGAQVPPPAPAEALETAADLASAELARRDLGEEAGPALRAVPAATPSPRTPRAGTPR